MASRKDIPVALIVFNRPQKTRDMLARIRDWGPEKLYIIADGPRPGSIQDSVCCKATRAVVDECINWPCQVTRIYADENMGCGRRTTSGISEVFEHEDKAIIFDDDCLPDISFFAFATELLVRYEDTPGIMQICGSSWELGPEAEKDNDSYFFSIYPFCWGWATWKRAWKHMRFETPSWSQERNNPAFFETTLSPNATQNWMHQNWDRTFTSKTLDAWDYYWYYHIHKNKGLSIVPTQNLIVNIGCDPSGTHTDAGKPPIRRYELESLSFPLKHPSTMAPHPHYDAAFQDICTSYNEETTPSSLTYIKEKVRVPLKKIKNTLEALSVKANPAIIRSKSRYLDKIKTIAPLAKTKELHYPGYYATYRAAQYIQDYHCSHILEVGSGPSTLGLIHELERRGISPNISSITYKKEDIELIEHGCQHFQSKISCNSILAPLEEYKESIDSSFWYSLNAIETALSQQPKIDFLWIHDPIDPGLPSSWPLFNALTALGKYLSSEACISICPLNEIDGIQLSLKAKDTLDLSFKNEMHRYQSFTCMPQSSP